MHTSTGFRDRREGASFIGVLCVKENDHELSGTVGYLFRPVSALLGHLHCRRFAQTPRAAAELQHLGLQVPRPRIGMFC